MKIKYFLDREKLEVQLIKNKMLKKHLARDLNITNVHLSHKIKSKGFSESQVMFLCELLCCTKDELM